MKHEYGDWDEKNPKVTTCSADNKITPGSNTPQEVAADTYVVFSYDVTFQVCTFFLELTLFWYVLLTSEFVYCSPAKSNGHHDGTLTFS